MKQFTIYNLQLRINNLSARVYAAILFTAFVGMFNLFTAVMVALFFITCFLFARALKEIKWRSIFFEEDKEY